MDRRDDVHANDGGEGGGGPIVRDVNETTVDLTRLQGANATVAVGERADSLTLGRTFGDDTVANGGNASEPEDGGGT